MSSAVVMDVVPTLTRKRRRASSSSGRRAKRSRSAFKKSRAPKNQGMLRTAGLLGIEHKYFDTYINGANVVDTPDMSGGEIILKQGGSGSGFGTAVTCFNGMKQGDTASERDGRLISMTRLDVKGYVQLPQQLVDSSPDPTSCFYVAVVLDTQTNGAPLSSETVFYSCAEAALDGSATFTTIPFRNMEHSSRFRVLRAIHIEPKDFGYRPHVFNATTGVDKVTSADQVAPFEMHLNLRGLKTLFKTGGGGGIANIIDNSIHLLAFCQDDVNQQPKIWCQARLRFYG